MIQIDRDKYLKQLIDGRENGLIKIITGIRRCGKSYLLFRLFYSHLISSGVSEDHIIRIALDDIESEVLREPLTLYRHVKGLMTGDGLYYILLDERRLISLSTEEVSDSIFSQHLLCRQRKRCCGNLPPCSVSMMLSRSSLSCVMIYA